MSLAGVDTRSYKDRVNKKSFPLRLAPAQVERLAQVAAKMQVSKTSIIEAAIDARLDLLEGYEALDKGPPKTAAAVKRQVAKLAPVAGRSIRGYDAITGEALYR